MESHQSFENILCTQFTIVHIMQTKSVTQYRLAPCVMPRLINYTVFLWSHSRQNQLPKSG